VTATAASAPHAVAPKLWQKAVLDLQATKPGPGLVKAATLTALVAPCAYGAVSAESGWAFFAWAALAGYFLVAMLITTHDAIHHTFTGWRWFDEIFPRLVSWPVIWVHGTYAEVHKLHHKMNGDEYADPERVQWTVEEYERAGPLGKFYVRHQWVLDILVFGGLGLIYKTASHAYRLRAKSKGIRRQLALDLVGIVGSNAVIYTVAASHGAAVRWFLFWVIAERMGGAVLQWRAHVEHYGLWGKGRHYFETQAYACRNVTTSRFVSWYMNGLNFHSAHHMFPRIPFYHLREAHRRLGDLARDHGAGLVQDLGYMAVTRRLVGAPALIGGVDPASERGSRMQVAIPAG
jgi:fatty acid desaturase